MPRLLSCHGQDLVFNMLFFIEPCYFYFLKYAYNREMERQSVTCNKFQEFEK